MSRTWIVQIAVWLGNLAGEVGPRLKLGRGERFYAEAMGRLIESLAKSREMNDMFRAIERSFLAAFRLHVGVVVLESGGSGMRVCSTSFRFGAGDWEAAAIAVREGRPAGFGTMAVPDATSYFLPLHTSGGVVGALGCKPDGRITRPEISGGPIFHAFCNQVALAVLRLRLDEQAQRARLLQETDRLQKALLSSISHNVRTPLASILGSLSTLRDEGSKLDESTRRELIDNALAEAERLNRLLGNLLDLSRLEGGALQVRMDPCDVQDVIGAALEQLGPAASNRSIRVDIAPELPFVCMDFVLIVQVIVNLLDNALKYSAPNEPITLETAVLNDRFEVRVLDLGNGIPEHELTNVFDKFNRAGRTGETGGVGLGLSICKGLVEAHHGRIWAERREPRGTTLAFFLPFNGARYPARNEKQ